jgi:peptidoglycan/xylan/chitin deacetylase (PgdA/CDA1 family)
LKSNISSDEYQWLLSKYKSLLPLNWQEVKEIIGYCGTIGSHCMDHICCHSGQPDTEVRSQIFKSKLLIEERLGQSCDYIAYPNGDFTDFSNSCVRSAGYKLGFSTKRNKIKPDKGQMFNVPRISLPYNYKTFQIITGLYPKG